MAVTTTTLLNVVSAAHTTTLNTASTACALFQTLNVCVNVTAFIGSPGPNNSQTDFPVVIVNLYRVEPDAAAVQTLLGSFPVRATSPTVGSAAAHSFGVGCEFGQDIGGNFILQIVLAGGITSATYTYTVVGKGSS